MTNHPERTVLIVEDNRDDSLLLRRLLREGAGRFRVREVGTGGEGIEQVLREPPDLVLLDFYLQDMTGTQFIDALQAERAAAPRVPVIVLTGHEDESTASEVLSHGAMDYLVKGTLTGPGLVRAIQNGIGKFAIQRELQEKRAALELRNWELETLRDELQAKLAELADAHRAKDQFLAVMSHEMRTPLNAILGYADLLEMGIGGELTEGQRVHLERIRVGGRHLLDLINDVLDLARADANKLEMDLRPVDLRAVVEEVLALLERQAGAKGLELRRQCAWEELPLVQADLQRLRQVLTNLIGNAIKFTEEGSITVECPPPDGNTVLLRVIDTGIGIEPHVLPLIFNEFFQVEGDLTREHGGTGLGLAIAQRLTRLMGGNIAAHSVPGEGSTFTISLRRAAPGSTPRVADVEAHGARMEAHGATQRRREAEPRAAVVAFGDDADALTALEARVRHAVSLAWTTNPDETAELARRERAALVVLEIAAADGAAWRIAHALQDIPELAETAVLLLPRIPPADAEEGVGGISLGWVSLVPKPFTSEQLTHAVARAAYDAMDGGETDRDSPYTVLVVDDDEDSRRVAAHFLGEAGATVRQAADGETALLAMRRRPPDVVVLDLMMPVLDGFGVLATMRADPLLSSIPVVVLSAKTLTQAEREFLSRTAVRVLQKGEHRLADVAALVLRAADGASRSVGHIQNPRLPEP